MQDLYCNLFHPYYFSSTQNTKAEDHHSAKTIHNFTTLVPKKTKLKALVKAISQF
jgi:hypothetical protein